MNQKPKHSPQHNAQPDRKKTIIIIVIAAVTILLIVGATVFALLFLSKNAKQTEPTLAPTQAAATQASVNSSVPSFTAQPESTGETTPAATEEAPDSVEMDDELKRMLEKQDISPDNLSQQGTSQIVTVSSSGNAATIEFWEIRDNRWTKDDALTASGSIGEMGATYDMSEYIKATPIGFFPVKDAFYIHSKPETGLESFQITEDTYWVDDPSSDFYNQRVEGTQYMDWSSAEHMIDYSAYEYGFVIGYNLSCVKGAGSAIFFHIGSGPTAGCVATSESYVLSYLAKLSSDANPYILIN